MSYDLTRFSLVKTLLRSRWPQFLLTLFALSGFLLIILAGWLGTPVGNRNAAIVLVWIVWWAALMLAIVPFLGRGWCAICPLPVAGEWLQRGALLAPQGKGLGAGRRWPRRLRNIWLQNAAFVALALFSGVILTQPRLTSAVLLLLLLLAIGASLVFERRAFCRYLCPVGGFIGLYAQLAPLQLRVKDTAVCASHNQKTCYTGSAEGYGCPWDVFPGGLMKNTSCGLCMECLRVCPYDNIALQLRPFGHDLSHISGRKLDEAYKAFIMLGSALLYAAVYLGPWGNLKRTAYSIGSLSWLGYGLAFLGLALGILPGLFWLAVQAGRWLSRNPMPIRKAFVHLSYALLPLGLCAWVAFSLSFVMANFSYLWPVLSDPLGWGWNLFGSADFPWKPYLGGLVPSLQQVVLLLGFFWSGRTAHQIAAETLSQPRAGLQAAPLMAFFLMVTLILFGLLIW